MRAEKEHRTSRPRRNAILAITLCHGWEPVLTMRVSSMAAHNVITVLTRRVNLLHTSPVLRYAKLAMVRHHGNPLYVSTIPRWWECVRVVTTGYAPWVKAQVIFLRSRSVIPVIPRRPGQALFSTTPELLAGVFSVTMEPTQLESPLIISTPPIFVKLAIFPRLGCHRRQSITITSLEAVQVVIMVSRRPVKVLRTLQRRRSVIVAIVHSPGYLPVSVMLGL